MLKIPGSMEKEKELLRGVFLSLRPRLPHIVEEFHRRIKELPGVARIFSNFPPDFLDALKERHMKYFEELLKGEGFPGSPEVGRKHLLVGVDPELYMQGYSILVEEILKVLGALSSLEASSLFKLFILDISTSLRAYFEEKEKRVEAVSRLYKVLSSVNSLIVRVEDREELLREACKVLVEDGGYKGARISVVEDEGLKVVASWGEAESTHFPEEKAIKQGSPIFEDGFAAFPMRSYLGIVGALGVNLGKVKGLPEEEVELFSKIGNELSYALRTFEERRRFEYISSYDPLTGLPNRKQFISKLNRLIESSKHRKRDIGVMILDIDRFKHINDAYGYSFGDLVLKAVGERLQKLLRGEDQVGKLGSDEFGVVLVDVKGEKGILRVINRIRKAFKRSFLMDGKPVYITFSMGISLFPRDGERGEDLLRGAEVALSKARSHGGDTFFFFSQEADRDVKEFIDMEMKLRKALEKNEFVLFYQPKVDLKSFRVTGAEALIRWRSPQEGLVPPGKFIPVLESLGIIVDVGEWVLREAARQAKEWMEKGMPLRIAANVSALQFRDKEFVDKVKKAVSHCGLPPELFEIEITESLVMQDVEKAIGILEELRGFGIGVTMDDFGTGYSSLAYLKNLPVDSLKVDISFVRGIPHRQEDMRITKVIVDIAEIFGLRSVAEGVERKDQVEVLKNMGCHEIQGFYFSPPVPPEEFVKIFEKLEGGKP